MAGNGEIKEDGGKGVKDIYGCAIHTNKKKPREFTRLTQEIGINRE